MVEYAQVNITREGTARLVVKKLSSIVLHVMIEGVLEGPGTAMRVQANNAKLSTRVK